MGGKTFPKLSTPRMLTEEYTTVRDRCIKTLQKFYCNVCCPPEGPGKIDHGDVDILVSVPLTAAGPEQLAEELNAVDHTKTKPLSSFAVPLDRGKNEAYVQVDVSVCEPNLLEWQTWMNSYGDLSQILGVLNNPVDLTMTTEGLFARLCDGYPDLLFLTKDYRNAIGFLGLDKEQYEEGFKTPEQMFEWCSKGKFYRAPTGKDAHRLGMRGRLVFDYFLQYWAHSHPEAWPKVQVSIDKVLQLAVSTFQVRSQRRFQVTRHRKLLQIAEAVSPTSRARPEEKIEKFKRWVDFKEKGSPVLRSFEEASELPEIDLLDWLDRISENRHKEYQTWIKENLAEINRREKIHSSRGSLGQNIKKMLEAIPNKNWKESKLDLEILKREIAVCACLGSASEDRGLLDLYVSCSAEFKKLTDDKTQILDYCLDENQALVDQLWSLWSRAASTLPDLKQFMQQSDFKICYWYIGKLKDHLSNYSQSADKAQTDNENGVNLVGIDNALISFRDCRFDDRMKRVLDRLQKYKTDVLEPFDFTLEKYKEELKVCSIIFDHSRGLLTNDRMLTSGLGLSANDVILKHHRLQIMALEEAEWSEPEEDISENIESSAQVAIIRNAPQCNRGSSDEEYVLISVAQRVWMKTQGELRNKRKYMSEDTFKRCQDRIRQVLLHLSIYARAFRKDGQVGRAQNMHILAKAISHKYTKPQLDENREKKVDVRHREGQNTFRNELKSYYDCQNGDKIWCPVIGRWAQIEQCTAAHIVPYSFPADLLKYFLLPKDPDGPSQDLSDPSMVPQNGLYLYNTIEKALDDGKLVIVPYSQNDDVVDFRVVLLDESLRDNASFKFDGSEISWLELDGKSLDFRNGNRPGKNFLYFQMLMTVVYKCMYQPPSWAYRLNELVQAKEKIALTPRSDFVDGPLMRMSRMITDAVVFKKVSETIPMDGTVLPSDLSQDERDQVESELDVTIGDIFGLIGTNALEFDSDSTSMSENA